MRDNPSVHESNKAVRVLSDQKLKFTLRLHLPDGKIIEWQADRAPKLDWNSEARALWLTAGGYDTAPLTPWIEGSFLLCEQNPE